VLKDRRFDPAVLFPCGHIGVSTVLENVELEALSSNVDDPVLGNARLPIQLAENGGVLADGNTYIGAESSVES
jgi:hypothetical protein